MPRASHIGKIRQQLAKAIEQAFAAKDIIVYCDPANLWPAQGAWRTDTRLDVMRWEGFIQTSNNQGRMVRHTIESWDTMSDCLKGFSIRQAIDGSHGFEVSADNTLGRRYIYED
jgi:hypothetical protein